MDFAKLKQDIVSKLVLLAILTSPGWISGAILTYLAVGENVEAIAANSTAIIELTETLGGMNQLFGNAEILENGTELTASINTHSNAVRFREGQELRVTNTSDRTETTITIIVRGKFEDEPHLLLNLSSASGRAIRASAKEIQVAIEPTEK